MTGRRKLLVVLGILGLFAVGVPVTLLIIWKDESPPDDSDLLPQRLAVSDADNAYTFYRQAARVLVWPCYKPEDEGEASSEEPAAAEDEEKQKAETEKRDLLDYIGCGKNWDAAAAADVLQQNKETLALLEKGLACRECQFPEVKTIDDMLKRDGTLGCLALCRLWRVRVEVLAHEGKTAEAVDEALKVIRFGDHVEQSRGILSTWLVGMTAKQMGMDSLRRIALASSLPPDRLLACARWLGECEHDSEGYADALRAEYAMSWNMVEVGLMAKLDQVRKEHGFWGQVSPTGWLFKPNATKRCFVDIFRLKIANAGRPYAEAVSGPASAYAPMTLKNHVKGNVTGQMIFRVLQPPVGALKIKCQAKTEAEVTRALLALKAFKLKTGRLPATLDELVPDYLPSVPLDDFSGKPIRYSAEKKIGYSLGQDLKDVGGFTKDEAQAWYERTESEDSRKDYPEPEQWKIPNPSWPIDF